MTEQQPIEDPITAETALDTPEAKALAKRAIDEIARGKTTFADVWAALTSPEAEVAPTPSMSVPAITEAQSQALKRLPEVYGSVTPSAPRKLTMPELVSLVEERDTIDLVLAFAEKRKKESIREALANHFDHVYKVPEGKEGYQPRHDAKGHIAEKQEVSVQGTGRKVQAIPSGGKPVLEMEAVMKAYENGVLTRAEYLAITRKPDLPRVLNEDGMAKAIKKDPSLLFRLAALTTPTKPTLTIKVVNDN